MILNKIEDSKTNFVARLLYYRRSFSKLPTGDIIDYGPGIVFSFILPDEASGCQYMRLKIDDLHEIVIGPASDLRNGSYLIDHSREGFVIKNL